jgi:hypothetical protein
LYDYSSSHDYDDDDDEDRRSIMLPSSKAIVEVS